MTSPSIFSRNNRAFTLIEILIVIAILTVLMGLGLFMSFDSYRSYLSRSEQDTVVSLLQRARSRAMANIQHTTWGVCYVAPQYVLFPGTVCDAALSTSEITPGNPGAVVQFLDAPSVIFSQLSATTTNNRIIITEGAKISTTTINHEGTIIW